MKDSLSSETRAKLSGRQQALIDSIAAAASLGRHLVVYRNDRAARGRLERLGLIVFDSHAGEYKLTDQGRLYVSP